MWVWAPDGCGVHARAVCGHLMGVVCMPVLCVGIRWVWQLHRSVSAQVSKASEHRIKDSGGQQEGRVAGPAPLPTECPPASGSRACEPLSPLCPVAHSKACTHQQACREGPWGQKMEKGVSRKRGHQPSEQDPPRHLDSSAEASAAPRSWRAQERPFHRGGPRHNLTCNTQLSACRQKASCSEWVWSLLLFRGWGSHPGTRVSQVKET